MTVPTARKELGFPDNVDHPKDMVIDLMPHQIVRLPPFGCRLPILSVHAQIGVCWMNRQEQSGLQGGILSDEMGLGKTVQMIGQMLMNPPTDKREKTTLILACVRSLV